MKIKTFKISALVLAGISLSSCDSLKELTYTVTPDPLEMHGDSVRVKIEVKVPEKGIKKKIVAEITPKLGSQSLEPVKVAGEKIQIGEKSIPFKPGGKVVYDRTYAYDPSFESSDLEIARAIVHLQRFGISPRHLRGLKASADREIGIIEGVVAPVLSKNEAASKSRATHYAQEIENQFAAIRSELIKSVISKIDK
jgi:hypothetical protein